LAGVGVVWGGVPPDSVREATDSTE
jgi:hypothetical protein